MRFELDGYGCIRVTQAEICVTFTPAHLASLNTFAQENWHVDNTNNCVIHDSDLGNLPLANQTGGKD